MTTTIIGPGHDDYEATYAMWVNLGRPGREYDAGDYVYWVVEDNGVVTFFRSALKPGLKTLFRYRYGDKGQRYP